LRLGVETLVSTFFEGHDPTQVMRQGNDVGTQYRSVLLATSPAQLEVATAVRDRYQERLDAAGYGTIATDLAEARDFYYAEGYHQQYPAKNPRGYCGRGGTGVSCPVGLAG